MCNAVRCNTKGQVSGVITMTSEKLLCVWSIFVVFTFHFLNWTFETFMNHLLNFYLVPTVLFIFLSPPRFLLEIRVIIKISKKFLVSHKLWLIWIRMKQKKIFFLKKKIQNGRLKKTEFFNYPQKLSNCRQNFTDWSLG